MAEILIISEKDLPAFADRIASMVLRSMGKQMKADHDPDPYMEPSQLEEILPALKASTIKYHIRKAHYGKKMGGKGKLVAKASEVKNHHKL